MRALLRQQAGPPSLPPGRYFRMHLIGYFEGIDSERGLEWRCADSLSLRDFLRLTTTERVPDHSWLSKTALGGAQGSVQAAAEQGERSFALTLDRGGMRRAWLRGRENLHKRYLVHVAGYIWAAVVMRAWSARAPGSVARARCAFAGLTTTEGAAIIILAVVTDTEATIPRQRKLPPPD